MKKIYRTEVVVFDKKFSIFIKNNNLSPKKSFPHAFWV